MVQPQDARALEELGAGTALLRQMRAEWWRRRHRRILYVLIALTVLELAGLRPPGHLRGQSLVALARGKEVPWRDALLYEYYWERNYPQTPTLHALRSDTHKYIRAHGVWDLDELFDLRSDPGEENNLIFSPGHEGLATQMNARLFELLGETHGMDIPMKPDTGARYLLRRSEGSSAAGFPKQFFKP